MIDRTEDDARRRACRFHDFGGERRAAFGERGQSNLFALPLEPELEPCVRTIEYRERRFGDEVKYLCMGDINK